MKIPYYKLLLFVLLIVGCAPNVSENENQNDESMWDGSACNMSEDSIHIKANGSVLYNISTDIYGFQFNVDGATVLGTSGGAAGDAGFSVSAGNNTVLGFSLSGKTIPAGCGELVNLSLNQSPSMLSQIIFSIENGESISIEYFSGE